MDSSWKQYLPDNKQKDENQLNKLYANQLTAKNDDCYISQQNNDNKSIYSYRTDNNMYVNKNGCFDTTPPFFNYSPYGIREQNIEIENDLRNSKRLNNRCIDTKYLPVDVSLVQNVSKAPLYNLKECSSEYKIYPNGYFHQ